MEKTVPVTVYDSVLPADRFESLQQEISQSNLDFVQQYPNRLFTDPKHEAWLRSYFDPFIQQLTEDTGLNLYVQQIFIGFELPGCQFLLHRSHPNIACVANFSLNDFALNKLICLTDSQDDPEDYLWGRKNYKSVDFEFRANRAIVVHNPEVRPHWGFPFPIGENIVKKSVWIYFGKNA